MGKSHGRLLSFKVTSPSTTASQVDLSTYTIEVSGLPGEQDLGDVTAAGNVGHQSYPGLQNVSFTTKMTFDDASTGSPSWGTLGSFQNLQQTYATTSWAIQYGPRGTTAAAALIGCNALIKSISIPGKVTDPNFMNVSWQLTGTTGVSIGVWS